jgi:tRNA threonylcarbamoyl adenosine modification protein (Sua5/YciO/YrdC/YwlC family)
VLLPINAEHPEPRKVARAVELLEKGAVIGYPTDTVYGLGCDLSNKNAIERLYQIKGMSRDKSLAFICPDLAEISKYAVVENAVYRPRATSPRSCRRDRRRWASASPTTR